MSLSYLAVLRLSLQLQHCPHFLFHLFHILFPANTHRATNLPRIYETQLGSQKCKLVDQSFTVSTESFSLHHYSLQINHGAPNKYLAALLSRLNRLEFETRQQPLFCSAVNFTSVNAVVERQGGKQRASSSDRFLCISKTLSYNSQGVSCVFQQCSKAVCQKTLKK